MGRAKLMKETPQSIASRLEQEGEMTIAFIQQISADQLDQQVYEGGAAWTVREVLTHLVEAEGSIPRLIASILAGSKGVSEDFDLDRYNESQVRKMGPLSQEEIIKRFSDLRSENLEMVSGLDEMDFQATGRHPFLGEANVAAILRLMYMNAKMHIRDIRRVLKIS